MSYASYEQYLSSVFSGQRHVDLCGQCYWCGAEMDELDWAAARARGDGMAACAECEERILEDARA